MDSLTVALAALGGLVLAGVVAHGAWQARRAGPKRVAVPPAVAPHVEPREPTLDESSGEPDALAAPMLEARVAKRPAARLDALIDAIAPLSLEAPLSAEMVLAHLPPTRRAGSKPFLIEGRNAQSGDWEPIQPGQRYSEFQAGVQLANRTGPLNEIEYSEFVQKIEAFAEAIGAMADFPDMIDVVARARELDAFAGEHDAQLAVRLQARSAAWSVGYLQQHAARHGFVAGVVPGRLVLPSHDDGAPPVLSLTFDPQAAFADDPGQAVVHDVTLSFDVPQTDPAADPFIAWQASAQALALGMDAAIVDDHGRPLGPDSFTAIGNELGQLYDKLQARDLGAGSATARRLFS